MILRQQWLLCPPHLLQPLSLPPPPSLPCQPALPVRHCPSAVAPDQDRHAGRQGRMWGGGRRCTCHRPAQQQPAYAPPRQVALTGSTAERQPSLLLARPTIQIRAWHAYTLLPTRLHHACTRSTTRGWPMWGVGCGTTPLTCSTPAYHAVLTSKELKKVLIEIYCIEKCLLDLNPI
jgi:hypothetical protein